MIVLICLFWNFTLVQIWWGMKTLFFHYLFWLGFMIFAVPLLEPNKRSKADKEIDAIMSMLAPILLALFTFLFYTTQLRGMQ